MFDEKVTRNIPNYSSAGSSPFKFRQAIAQIFALINPATQIHTNPPVFNYKYIPWYPWVMPRAHSSLCVQKINLALYRCSLLCREGKNIILNYKS